MKVVIASDHAGFPLKEEIKNHFASRIDFIDVGTHSEDSCDYPDFAHKAAKVFIEGEAEWGIAICGSGNGINMSMNKHKMIRSALCWTKELSELARLHNNANFLAMPGRYIEASLAYEIVEIFMTTEFEGGRHERRVRKISDF
ncbi:MAG: ribose 5-phosphate isomerase B [Marinilabiliales bacterium]|mgnify:CR=1 FL=1|nr:MAG: ribose 5-phosphate isomerase B [Marinilabiliales bacterium]